jgi:hypothetical protein
MSERLPPYRAPDPPVRRRNWLVFGLGWIFLGLGLTGLFLPGLQGVLLLAVGLVLLSREAAWARRLREWLFARFPALRTRARRAEASVRALLMRGRRRRNNG